APLPRLPVSRRRHQGALTHRARRSWESLALRGRRLIARLILGPVHWKACARLRILLVPIIAFLRPWEIQRKRCAGLNLLSAEQSGPSVAGRSEKPRNPAANGM